MTYMPGIDDLRNKLLPDNGAFDTAYLEELRLSDGTNAVQVLEYLALAIANFNAGLLDNDNDMNNWLASVIHITDKVTAKYSDGGTPQYEPRTEYGLPGSVRTVGNGHMMRMAFWDKGLGFTKQRLEQMMFDDAQNTIDDLLDGAKNKIEADVLTTLTLNDDRPVGENGITVPFVGGGSIDYTPKTYKGKIFSSSHSHYLRYVEAALAEAIDAAAYHLKEHGILGPWDAFISESDMSFYAGLDDNTYKVKWIPPQHMGIVYGSDLTLASQMMVSSEKSYGIIETSHGVIRLRTTNRISSQPGVQRNMVVYKSYGINAASNPIYWRIDPMKGGVMWAGEISTDFGAATTRNWYTYVNGASSVGISRLPVVNICFAPADPYLPPTITE